MAWIAVSATTTATGSPTKRTRPVASRVRVISWLNIGISGGAGSKPKSSAVEIATTPGISDAALVSIDRISPCATIERTNAAWSALSALTSST